MREENSVINLECASIGFSNHCSLIPNPGSLFTPLSRTNKLGRILASS